MKVEGQIRLSGRGLLLAGGNGQVPERTGDRVSLLLSSAGLPPALLLPAQVQPGVPLEADGDFTINDVLSPAPPNPCTTPVLLIQTTGGTHPWFAAGIPAES